MGKVKKVGVLLLPFLVSLILLFFLQFKQKIDFLSVWQFIRHSDKHLLLLAVFFTFLIYVFCYLRWRMLLHSVGVFPDEKRILSAFSGGVFFNALPSSTIGGDVVRSIDLAKKTNKTKEVVATVIVDRLSGFVGMMIISLVALSLGLKIVKDKAVIFTILGLTLGLVLVLLVLFNEAIFTLVNGWMKKIKWGGRITRGILAVHEELYYFRGRKWMMAKNICLSVIVQFIGPIASYYTAKAIGINVSVLYFFVFVPVISTITALPISALGLGVRDVSTVSFFGKVGVSQNAAEALSSFGFAFVALFAALGGLIYVFTLHRRRL